MICKGWFSEGANSLGLLRADAFNPNGDGIPFETIALILTAVCHSIVVLQYHVNSMLQLHNAIVEYEKGYFVQREFSAKLFGKQYTKYLLKLQSWHTYTTTKSNSFAAEKLRRELFAATR